MTQALVKKFFDRWSIYDNVLAHHYRYHDDLYWEVQHVISRHSADRHFAVFDLGCGSALQVAHALKNSPICRYRGDDLSDLARMPVMVALVGPSQPGNRVLYPDSAGLTVNRSLEEASAWRT